jgi:hypothetical protein
MVNAFEEIGLQRHSPAVLTPGGRLPDAMPGVIQNGVCDVEVE